MKNVNNLSYLFYAVLCITGLWFFYAIIIFSKIDNNSISSIGQYGDAFGALNTLFSGFALAGLAYNVILQHQELSYIKDQYQTQTELMTLTALLQGYNQNVAFLDDMLKDLDKEEKETMSDSYPLNMLQSNKEDVFATKRGAYKGKRAEYLAAAGSILLRLEHLQKQATQRA